MNKNFIESILNRDEFQELPGWNAQKKMSPEFRADYDLEQIKKYNPKIAAVLILLYQNQMGDWEFPIILRNIYPGVHSNQYGLPGGSFEPEDMSYDFTAIREATEEIGVYSENIEIVMQMSELYIPPSQFLVYPFIGIHHGFPNFVPDIQEVQEIVPIDLEALMAAKPNQMLIEREEEQVQVPAYQIGENSYIWGATAMMLEELKEIIKQNI